MQSIVFQALLFYIVAILTSGCNPQQPPNAEKKQEEKSILRISSLTDPQSLDPRVPRDLPSVTFLHMLYEGLMRFDLNGNLVHGLAKNVHLSKDLKTYTFELRDSQWSNGDVLTAQDFVDSWTSILTPSFAAPNAYQLFVIKGAKAAKEGKAPISEIGLHAAGPTTLVVELESPTPYFLELTAAHFYYPVHSSLRLDADKPQTATVIANGPFVLKNWSHHNEVSVEKNPLYWDAANVRLDGITAVILDENTALQLFETGNLEWTGSPLCTLPADAIANLKKQEKLKIAQAAGTHWFRINTEKPPFANPKMRKAFSLAIDRKAIVEHVIQGNQTPAMGVVPPSLRLQNSPYFEDHDIPKAWYLFQDALKDMNISKEELPQITLCYSTNDRNHKIAQAVQQQWNKAFGINITLENCESQVLFDKMSKHDFQMAIGSWFADFRDPINFLEIFKYKNNSTNNTMWENPQYIELLNMSSLETKPEDRAKVLRSAERLLMDEMPVAPLFFSAFNYVKHEHLFGVYFSDLGFLDFKHAFIDKNGLERIGNGLE